MKENQKNQLKCRGTFQGNTRETDTTVLLKLQKGITLIALVITIIVLLILAGVTLSIVFNRGIINKSQTAVDKYAKESAKEKLTLALFNYKMGVITGEVGEGQITLDDYIEEIGGEIKETTATTYKILVDDVYEFIVGNKDYDIIVYTAYSVGDTFTVNGETFYVIKASDENTETVTGLAALNIDTNEGGEHATTYLTQQTSDISGSVAFSANKSWIAGENLNNNATVKADKKSAVYYAMKYAENLGATGRLMTANEVVELGGDNTENYTTANCPEWINRTNYWLGSANEANDVWSVYGNGKVFYSGSFDRAFSYGVRPVITISKSKI